MVTWLAGGMLRTTTLANAKAHLSALIDQVEQGDEVVITRRGRPIARIIPERPTTAVDQADLVAELRAFVTSQPQLDGDVVSAMREETRY
jgi:prevent-host-death family protein